MKKPNILKIPIKVQGKKNKIKSKDIKLVHYLSWSIMASRLEVGLTLGSRASS